MDEYMQAALKLTRAQASVRAMTAKEVSLFVRRLIRGLSDIDSRSEKKIEKISPRQARKSIKLHSITCLECGKSFRILTITHLAKHDLTKDEYLSKYGLPPDTVLACKDLQRERQQRMEEVQLWEKRRKPN